MSLVSYHKENRISSDAVIKLLADYVYTELLRVPTTQLKIARLDFLQDDGNELLQKVLNNSRHHLRMYGTAKELVENIKIYRDFTGCMETINADILEPYSMPPKIHKSFSDKEYIIKQDLFVHLQNLVLKHFPEVECMVMLSMILIFLKTKESQLDGCQQFVEYDKEEFAKLEAEVAALEKYMNKPGSLHFPMASSYELRVKKYNLSELLTQWKKIIPDKLRNCQFDGIEAILQSVLSELSPTEKPLFFKRRFHNLKVIIKGLNTIMDKRPLWFQPCDEDDPNTPKIIKVYEDYGESFVLIMDVYVTLGTDCIDKLEEYKTEDDPECVWGWKTISYDEFRRRFPEECKEIEFIHTPVIRAKHRAVPIMDTNGDPSLFAADALLELLRRMIFSAKLFQRVRLDKKVWTLITLFFEDHYHYFGTNNGIFVLTLENIAEINDIFKMTFNQYMEEELDTVKLVRNVKKDGFTVDNLKNELKYLGLTDAFPNITDFADIAYDHVFKNKKEEVLRTCDLFDALELCQLICIFQKFPTLAEFLHTQKCCHLILVECDYCSREKVENAGKVSGDLKKKLSIAESRIVELKKELKVAEEEEKTMTIGIEQQRTKEVEQIKLQIAGALQKAKDEADLFGKNLQLEKQLKKEHQVGESLQQEKKKQLEMKVAHLAEIEKIKERIKSETQSMNSSDDKELRKKNIRLKFQLNERKKTIENLLAELSL